MECLGYAYALIIQEQGRASKFALATLLYDSQDANLMFPTRSP
jgi:hypothetical protein